jgi:hypothetical protein
LWKHVDHPDADVVLDGADQQRTHAHTIQEGPTMANTIQEGPTTASTRPRRVIRLRLSELAVEIRFGKPSTAWHWASSLTSDGGQISGRTRSLNRRQCVPLQHAPWRRDSSLLYRIRVSDASSPPPIAARSAQHNGVMPHSAAQQPCWVWHDDIRQGGTMG